MALTFVYPAQADNPFKKYYFCYRIQQKLQNVHNTYGEKFRNGEITEAEWDQFRNEWFNPRSDLVIEEILSLRALAKNHSWNVDLSNVFVEA